MTIAELELPLQEPETSEIEEFIPPQTYTVEEFLELPTLENATDYELLEGELIEMGQTGGKHGEILINLGVSLKNYVRQTNSGHVFGGSGFLIGKRSVLAPDVAFVSTVRLPEIDYKVVQIPPDLAVEIVSPTDIWYNVDAKVDVYLQAGVKLVWVIYPPRKLVFAYHNESSEPQILTIIDELDGKDVLPDFKLKTSTIFE